MRGERARSARYQRDHRGSSPHARGTHQQIRFQPPRSTVHPRMRGERVRCFWKMACKKRFIPACAGNAGQRAAPFSDRSVHPRMRGERSGFGSRTPAGNGSSPHARGTPRKSSQVARVARFIPACAGNAFTGELVASAHTVHPRMRGERVVALTRGVYGVGSSPHARGTPDAHDAETVQRRFIPACAGNARHSPSGSSCQSVHPRMRGERMWRRSDTVGVRGSSPHARGTRQLLPGHLIEVRFIPACAGNAQYRHRIALHETVHPRMRGERYPALEAVSRAPGSSPHARGTRTDKVVVDDIRRFIPACAGNALPISY